MKKIITLIAVIGLFAINTEAKSLQAYLWYTSFYSPQDGPYIETYLSFNSNSLVYKQINDEEFQATLEITMIFSQNDSIRDFAKYELSSPLVDDTGYIKHDFIDQQRFGLPDGEYEFKITIADKNSDKEPFEYTELINISYPDDEIAISGIELVDSYTKTKTNNILSKSGYDLIPYVSNFYPNNKKEMIFYAEVYNTQKVLGEDGKYLISYYIESFETGKKISNYERTKRVNAGEVNPVLNQFNIANLPSGNYKLVIEVKDRKNKYVTSNSLFFQRSNPDIQFNIEDIAALDVSNTFAGKITNEDSLKEYIKCTTPIASEFEKQFIFKQIESSDLKTLQQFFLNFWRTRDNLYPADAWMDYLEEVKIVDKAYSTQVKRGYETDRGRVHLKYGPPNIITESYNEPSAYPYEIWHYYKLGDYQRNKRFVFYTYNLVTNDFSLLHSDAIGELSNYRWKVELHRRDYDPASIDATGPPDAWGNKAEDYYRNPR